MGTRTVAAGEALGRHEQMASGDFEEPSHNKAGMVALIIATVLVIAMVVGIGLMLMAITKQMAMMLIGVLILVASAA